MHIAILHNEPMPSRYDAMGEGVAVASVRVAVDAIKDALESLGHTVDILGLRPPLSRVVAVLKGVQADALFNLFEGFAGKPETEWQVALALESAGLAFTGAHASTLALCLDKGRAKQTLAARGIPTAPFQLLNAGNLERFSLDFPVIVKPLHEDASHGLNSRSVVYALEPLAQQVSWVESRYGSPVLVERYVPGREFNVSILGGQSPRVLPPTEITYQRDMPEPWILTYASKWLPEDATYQATTPVCPAPVTDAVGARIIQLALAAHSAVGAPPYSRVDFRMDEHGSLYVLEVNPNPDLSPNTGISIQAEAAGMEYAGLIEAILDTLLEEKRLAGITLRPMRPDDVEEMVRITRATGFFYPEEVEVARELMLEAAQNGDTSGYYVRVATQGQNVAGYVCFGPTPLTRGTWDIYWVAVDPQQQRQGIGNRLMSLAEEEIRSHEGRLVLVETSSRELYEPTRGFYKRLGYQEVSFIPDFYDEGDGRVTFAKVLSKGGGHAVRP